MVPLLAQYLEIGVKNDEQLIKMATIIQRAQSNSSTPQDGGLGISESEKAALLEDIKKLNNKDPEK